MNNDINLLPTTGKNVGQEIHLQRYKSIAFTILTITILTSVGIFLLSFDPTLSIIKKQENQVRTNLVYSQNKIGKYFFIKDRLKEIKTVLDKRTTYDTVITTIQAQMPNDISIDNVSISQKKMMISLSSTSLSSINTFLDKITDLFVQKNVFKTLTINNITVDEKAGKYSLSLESLLL